MAELKNHSIRVEDGVWKQIQALEGTTNDALKRLLEEKAPDGKHTFADIVAQEGAEWGGLADPRMAEVAFPDDIRVTLDEILEMLRSAPQLEDIGTLLGHLLSPGAVGSAASEVVVAGSVAPEKVRFGPQCKHCGEVFAGMRYATICPRCKSQGHTLTPSECPKCTEGAQL